MLLKVKGVNDSTTLKFTEKELATYPKNLLKALCECNGIPLRDAEYEKMTLIRELVRVSTAEIVRD